MKSTISIITIMLVVIAVMAGPASAHHQKIGNKTIVHSLPAANPNLTYDGNLTAKEAYELLIYNNPDDVILLDIRSPMERNGSHGGCIAQVALGIWIDPLNAGTPYWQNRTYCTADITNPIMPVHAQAQIGVAFNAQASDGTDLVGWPFRAAGFMIMNPDFDNYLSALEAEGIMAKSKPTIVMCASGWRAKYIAHYLKTQKAYQKVYVMDGGLSAWVKSGLPVSTNETAWIGWDRRKLYDPARLDAYGGARWPNSQFLTGGDPVMPEWMGQYVPSSDLVGYPDPTCPAPGNLVGLNGPWARDKKIEDLGIVPTLTSIKLPAGWDGPTLNSQCIQTMMGFKGMTYEQAVAACASAPAVVPGYFDAWPIAKGIMIEGAELPFKGADDPCGDMYTEFFGEGWYPRNLNQCEIRSIESTDSLTNTRYCNVGDPLCIGTRTYCFANPPFGARGFTKMTAPDGTFKTPAMTLNCDFMKFAE